MKPIQGMALNKYIISSKCKLKNAMEQLDKNGSGILLLTDKEGILWGIITDGDIRRALLSRLDLEESLDPVVVRNPVVGKADLGAKEALLMMDKAKAFTINQLPLLDENGRPVGLYLRRDMARPPVRLPAVIMAGGFGKRLLPLTEDMPKPMLPLGDRPLLEHTLERLKDAGIGEVLITTHFKGEVIKDHFGNGSRFGVNIGYVEESQPMGTAGALALLPKSEGPLLIINGDIISRLDYNAMYDEHISSGAALTVGVRNYAIKVPYGVLDCEGNEVRGLREKPTYNYFVNAGIYLIESSVRDLIPGDRSFDMTELIEQLLAQGKKVTSFPIIEYWLDIGQHQDYEQAQQDKEEGIV